MSPQVTKANLIDKIGLYSTAQTSAFVYVTDASASSTDAKFTKIDDIGYYYFDGTIWQKMKGAGGTPALDKWDLNGNTISSGQFLGTLNAVALQFKYNNANAGFLNDLNTSYGVNALPLTTSGTNNAALGINVLSANTTGTNNAAIGNNALVNNTTGANNTAIGLNALRANITKGDNVAIGTYALQANNANNNVAIGSGAMTTNTVGNLNVAIGRSALALNLNTNSSTAVGAYALANSTGASNTAIGNNALGDTQDASGNTAIGSSAVGSNKTGASNIGIGNNSLNGNISGSRNIGIGIGSLNINDLSGENVAIGHSTFSNLKNTVAGADYNVAVGNGSGSQLFTGRNNTFIGGRSGATAGGLTALSYATAIGAQATVGANNSIVLGRSTSAGNTDKVAIGIDIPTNALHIKSAKDPLRLEGVQVATTSLPVLVIAADGTVYKAAGTVAAKDSSTDNISTLKSIIDQQAAQVRILTQKLDHLISKVNSLK